MQLRAPALLLAAAYSRSRNAGSLKQLFPESSNFRHRAKVLLIKARATCLETLIKPILAALLPRVARSFLNANSVNLFIASSSSSHPSDSFFCSTAFCILSKYALFFPACWPSCILS
uniref:Uncharacterized protein n=1 Tax=Opuntia streptacantha TaxID=393608 RepID=A0A7C9CQN2_OPUST